MLLLLIGIGARSAQAQVRPADALAQMRAAYERLDYATVGVLAQDALENYRTYTRDELVEIHVLLGRVRFAQLRRQAAREQFEAALSLNPSLVLDPLLVSPKVLAFFRALKRELQVTREDRARAAPAPRYVLVHDPRPAATLRSMLLPGWGQLYKGQELKGWALIGLWGGALAGAGTAHLIRAQYRDAYLDAHDPEIIEANYRRYSTWHKVRNNLLLGAGLVWAYGLVDALLVWHPERGETVRALHLGPRVSSLGNGARLVLHF